MKIILIAALLITILFIFSLAKMSKISDEKLEELWGKRND